MRHLLFLCGRWITSSCRLKFCILSLISCKLQTLDTFSRTSGISFYEVRHACISRLKSPLNITHEVHSVNEITTQKDYMLCSVYTSFPCFAFKWYHYKLKVKCHLFQMCIKQVLAYEYSTAEMNLAILGQMDTWTQELKPYIIYIPLYNAKLTSFQNRVQVLVFKCLLLLGWGIFLRSKQKGTIIPRGLCLI